jgi:thioredoxin-like negative regulator of GroEL
VTKFNWTIVHFYHTDFERCKVMDKHLRTVAMAHPESQFLYINAEKAPFFVQRLQVRSLPTVCLFIDGKLKDKIIGFEGFSGDGFKTAELIQRLIRVGVITARPEEKFKLVKGSKRRNSSDEEENSDLE